VLKRLLVGSSVAFLVCFFVYGGLAEPLSPLGSTTLFTVPLVDSRRGLGGADKITSQNAVAFGAISNSQIPIRGPAQIFQFQGGTTETPSPTRLPGSKRYTVQDGDWIYKIARQFGVSPEAIIAANPRIDPDFLVAGQVIVIPGTGGGPLQPAESTPTSTPRVRQRAIGSPTVSVAAVQPVAPNAPTSTSQSVAINSKPKRYISPPMWILGPIQGTAEDEKYITDLFYYLDLNNIPITAFHFDSDNWQKCANTAEFKWSDALLGRMRAHNPPVRAIFWILPLIGKNCKEYGEAASQGFFVKNADGSPIVTSSWQGTGSWIDFNNPAAVAYWHSLLDRIFARAQGVIGGFYTDDLRPDLSADTAYSDAFVRDLVDYTRSKVPDGDVVMKADGSNTPDNAFLAQYGHLAYVNDLDSSFVGMREGIKRVLGMASVLPAPFNEFTGYSFRTPDSETYIRRLHWGAFQPIMENDPLPKNAVPWDPQYTPQVLASYRYYSTLHWQLQPFFHTYDQLAYQNNTPILVQPNAAKYSTGIGREFFVQYVTEKMQSIDVTLPAGQWINYWNEQELYSGPKTFSYPVPLGREPIFVSNGAIIPMQVRDAVTGHGTSASIGALTVNVFPNGHTTSAYYDISKWIVFDVNQSGSQLSLCTSTAPSQSLIYRIARWVNAPAQVTSRDGAIGVNATWGSPLPSLESEEAVDASAGGWYYDAAHQHLIIKLTKLGGFCP
jgi:LysM repeat protein